eukprot:738907-Rhodomonas_salina.1
MSSRKSETTTRQFQDVHNLIPIATRHSFQNCQIISAPQTRLSSDFELTSELGAGSFSNVITIIAMGRRDKRAGIEINCALLDHWSPESSEFGSDGKETDLSQIVKRALLIISWEKSWILRGRKKGKVEGLKRGPQGVNVFRGGNEKWRGRPHEQRPPADETHIFLNQNLQA